MTGLAATIDNARKEGDVVSHPVAASTKIFKGVPTFLKSATKVAFSPDSSVNTLANGDVFAGICLETADNSAGAASAIDVRLYQEGLFKLPFSDTLTQADVGKKVFVNNVSDDSVVTITSDAGNPESCIGTIAQVESASLAYVRIDNHIGNKADSVPGSASDLLETAAVTVLATATTGTATVTSGSTPIGIISTGNQDQLVDNVAVSGTTLTVTLAAAATANNTFKVTLLKA